MSGNPSSSPQTPRKPLAIGYIGKGMSTSADLEHPLDFSFYNMTALQGNVGVYYDMQLNVCAMAANMNHSDFRLIIHIIIFT